MADFKQWAPNPYSIAQLLTNRLDIGPLYNQEGTRADEFLYQAFKVQDKQRTMTDVFGLFQQVVEAVDRPTSTAEVMNLEQVKRAAEGFSTEQIERVLPYLVPLTDASFAASADADGGPADAARTWFEDSGALMIDDASFLDPIQGAVGDCYLISAMIALAWARPESWLRGLSSAGFTPQVEPSFIWQFQSRVEAERRRVKISGRIPIAGKRTPRYAKSASGEGWPGLIEKAYVVKVRAAESDSAEPTLANYQAIDRGCTPPRACQMLAGGRVRGEPLDTGPGAKIFAQDGRLGTPSGVMSKPVMAWTKEDIGETDREVFETTGLWPNHAYAVLGTMRSDHVVLRNPHGIATKVHPGYAEGSWEPGGREPVELNKRGVFGISPELFYKHFEHIGWVEHEPAPA